MSRIFRTVWPTLHRVSCSNQTSQSKARRSGAAVSCQLPPGGLQTTTLQTRIHVTCWSKKRDTPSLRCTRNNTKRANIRVYVLVSSSIPFFCAARFCTAWEERWCFAGSAALKARSGVTLLLPVDRRSVLKKSASVVAEDSTLMVTVFACFSRVSFVVSLNIVSAAEASSHVCLLRRLASSCRSRAWAAS